MTIPKVAQDGTSDYEGELCAVIGRTGRDITEEEALDYVLGYTASNDVSARKLQLLTAQWCFAKGLDGSCPLGTYEKTQSLGFHPSMIQRGRKPREQVLGHQTPYETLLFSVRYKDEKKQANI